MKARQREIYLLPFPFSDFSSQKIRPAVVLSHNKFNNSSKDVIVCGITSQIKQSPYSLTITTQSLQEGELFVTSQIKPDSILKISKNLLFKRIGKVNQETFMKTIERVQSLFREPS